MYNNELVFACVYQCHKYVIQFEADMSFFCVGFVVSYHCKDPVYGLVQSTLT
jgi:hypothetical protein